MPKVATVLTIKALEALEAAPKPSKRIEKPDAKVAGLHLIIQPTGRMSWAWRYRHAGRPRKLTIGPYPGIALPKAREKALEGYAALLAGRDPAAEKTAEKARAKAAFEGRDFFGPVAQRFILRHAIGAGGIAAPRNRSWAETARLLGFKPDPDKPGEFQSIPHSPLRAWHKRPVLEITRRDVIELLEQLHDRAPAVANRSLAALRKCFAWALANDIIPATPCAGVHAPAAEVSRDRVLSDDEIRWLWRATESMRPQFSILVQLLLVTAQRREEVAGLAGQELRWTETPLWELPAARAKNGVSHSVPLSGLAQDILRRLVPVGASNGLLLGCSGRTPFSGFGRAKRALDEEMMRIARSETGDPFFKIPHWTLHDLRRTAASGMASLKVAPHVIEAVLNHRCGVIRGVGAIYNRFSYFEEKREALNLWAVRIAQMTCPGPAPDMP